MAISNATNNSSPKDMYEGRSAYDKNFPKTSIQFHTGYKNRLFGKVDTLGNAIQLRDGYLSFFGTKDDNPNISCVNFVADAFQECRNAYSQQVQRGKINLSSQYFKDKLKVFAGWEKQEILFSKNNNDLYRKFLSYTINNNIKITKFEIFVENFISFLLSTDFPITRVGFFESIYNPPHTTGLVLDLYFGDAGSDETREAFISDANYGLVSELMAARGLRFDAQVPWRVIANIQSENLAKFIAPKYLNKDFKLQELFDKFYHKNYLTAGFPVFKEFKDTMKAYYNNYKTLFPKKDIFVDVGKCRIKNVFVFAEDIKFEPDSKEEDLYFLDIYFQVRQHETKVSLSSSQQQFYRQNYRGIYLFNKDKTKGLNLSLDFINYNLGTLAFRSPSVYEINLTRQGHNATM